MEVIEKSFMASRRRRAQQAMVTSDTSSSEAEQFEEKISQLQRMKMRLAEIDKAVLNGCEGCEVGQQVNHSLYQQEYMLGQTIDDISTSASLQ